MFSLDDFLNIPRFLHLVLTVIPSHLKGAIHTLLRFFPTHPLFNPFDNLLELFHISCRSEFAAQVAV